MDTLTERITRAILLAVGLIAAFALPAAPPSGGAALLPQHLEA